MELVRMPERKGWHFAGKVYAFNAACTKLKDLTYDIIGNVDADISFEENLISFLLSTVAENPRLGVGDNREHLK